MSILCLEAVQDVDGWSGKSGEELSNLGNTGVISEATISWGANNARNYTIEGSTVSNFSTKTTLVTKTAMPGGGRYDYIPVLSGSYRYIRVTGTARNGSTYQLYEFKMYGK
jgi:hypothetical protein